MEDNDNTEGENTGVKDRSKRTHGSVWLLLVLIVMAAGVGAYWWRDMQAKNDRKTDLAKISVLEAQVSTLQKNSTTSSSATNKPTTTLPSETVKNSIKDSITSGNTSALEGYMASTVKVSVAASGGIGDRTPAQVVSDLSYIDAATTPWNFKLDDVTLAKYGSGDYKTYFSSNSVVGKSANNYVIAFNFNAAGKINVILMTNSADLL